MEGKKIWKATWKAKRAERVYVCSCVHVDIHGDAHECGLHLLLHDRFGTSDGFSRPRGAACFSGA